MSTPLGSPRRRATLPGVMSVSPCGTARDEREDERHRHRENAEVERTMVRHCARSARSAPRPLDRMGAPVQIPISFHALLGLVTAPTSERTKCWAPPAMKPRGTGGGRSARLARVIRIALELEPPAVVASRNRRG